MDSTIMKGPSQTVEPDTSTSIELANMGAVSEKHGTQVDENDMDRMGKYPVLKVSLNKLSGDILTCLHVDQRQFKFLSIFGYSVILGNTWEWALMYATRTQIREQQLTFVFAAVLLWPSTTEALLVASGCLPLSV
jgi:choline transport protein